MPQVVLIQDVDGRKAGTKLSVTQKCMQDLLDAKYAVPSLELEDNAGSESRVKALVDQLVQKQLADKGHPRHLLENKSFGQKLQAASGAWRKMFDSEDDAGRAAYAMGCAAIAGCSRDPVVQKAYTQKIADMGIETKSMDGTFLVPVITIPAIIRLVEQYGVARRNMTKYPMATETTPYPRRRGGLTVYYPSIGNSITDSSITGDQVTLTAIKYAALTFIPKEYNEDSVIALGELVAIELALAFAKAEDTNVFLGDGTSTYGNCKGIGYMLGYAPVHGDLVAAHTGVSAGVITVAGTAVGTGWKEIVIEDIENVFGALPQFADMTTEAKVYCHRQFFYSVLVKLALGLGGANATEATQSLGGLAPKFLGHAVEFAQVMPRASDASQFCMFFGNLMLGAVMGDRRQFTLEQSTEFQFQNDLITIKGTERIAPTVHGVGDTVEPGPIVGLETGSTGSST